MKEGAGRNDAKIQDHRILEEGEMQAKQAGGRELNREPREKREIVGAGKLRAIKGIKEERSGNNGL